MVNEQRDVHYFVITYKTDEEKKLVVRFMGVLEMVDFHDVDALWEPDLNKFTITVTKDSVADIVSSIWNRMWIEFCDCNK